MPDIPRYSVIPDGTLQALHEATKKLMAFETVPSDVKVLVWDPDAEDWFPITGFIYDSVANTIKIYSDE